MKTCFLVFVFFLFILQNSIGQTNNILDFSDTIKISNLPDDTSKVNKLIQIAENLRDYNIDLGLEYAKKGLNLSKKLNYQIGIGLSNKTFGTLYYRMGIYDAALDYSLKAVQLFKKENQNYQLCRVYNNIGLIFFARLDTIKAMRYFEDAITIAKSLQNKTELSRILHNMALFEYEFGSINLAISYHQISYEYAREIDNKVLMAYNNCFIGKCYTRLNKFEEAKSNIEKSIFTFRKLKIPSLLAMAYNQYAYYFEYRKDYKNTIYYAKLGYDIGVKVGNKYMELEASDLLCKAYENTMDYKNALIYHKLNTKVAEILKNNNNIKAIEHIEQKFIYEEKIKEYKLIKEHEISKSKLIAKVAIYVAILLLSLSVVLYFFYRLRTRRNIVLQQKNEEIILLNSKLTDVVKTKDKFFSIIAHDLRSPFNGFLNLTHLMAEDLQSMDRTTIQKIAVSLNVSATNLFKLLENLLLWSKMQQGMISFQPQVLDLNDIIKDCLLMFADSAKAKEIDISIEVPQACKLIADQNQLKTILRNLISNAIKFTNRSGNIKICSTECINDTIEISIHDTGIGMDKSMIEKLFNTDFIPKRKGTEGEDSSGLGLIICKEFIERHGGKIWVKSTLNEGSSFYIVLPCIQNQLQNPQNTSEKDYYQALE